MSASLVGSEMCIRDSARTFASPRGKLASLLGSLMQRRWSLSSFGVAQRAVILWPSAFCAGLQFRGCQGLPFVACGPHAHDSHGALVRA
eukprot:2129417-Alexandrium_andersonii.AAC.1